MLLILKSVFDFFGFLFRFWNGLKKQGKMETKIATKPKLVESPKGWYIYFSVRDHRTGKMHPKKIERGFKGCKTKSEKYALANKLIEEYTLKLKQGWVPWHDPESIYEDEINYQFENQKYSSKRKSRNTIRRLLSNFLTERKLSLKKKSYQTYQSKFRIFNQFLERKQYIDFDISAINNKIIIEFFTELIKIRELDRRSVNNYKIILSAFFNHLLEQKLIYKSPIFNIPKAHKIKDNAPLPILPVDLQTLLSEIKKRDSQLYLACLMQYYCAIRPGNELRTLQIKHLNLWAGIIMISGVNGKMRERTINIPDQFLKVLISDYKLQNYNKEYFIFGNERKPGEKPVGNNNLRVRFNTIRDELGLNKDYKFYSMKHTGAGFLLDVPGITIKDLQEHLGHTNINSTYHYIKKYRGMTSEKIKHSFPNPFPNEKE